jgi:1,4-alpha-glucan branching enzyme
MIRTEPGPSPDEVKVTFALREPFDLDAERAISVVGDFNGWHPGATPFARRSDGSLEATAIVRAGERYGFRYLGEDNRWLNDVDVAERESNGWGGENTVLDLSAWEVDSASADASRPDSRLADPRGRGRSAGASRPGSRLADQRGTR